MFPRPLHLSNIFFIIIMFFLPLTFLLIVLVVFLPLLCAMLLIVVNNASGDFDVKWSFLGTCLAWERIRCQGCALSRGV